MYHLFTRLLRWLVRAEEAHALYTWVLPLIPAGFGGVLAAFAAQQGWVVWLSAISSYSLFALGRYFTARYAMDHSLKGRITMSCHGLRITSVNEERGFATKTLDFMIINHAEFPIAIKLKSKFQNDGRHYEDDDFDPVTILAPKSSRGVFSGPIQNVSPLDTHYIGTVEALYGRHENNMKTQMIFKVRDYHDNGFSILQMEYKNA